MLEGKIMISVVDQRTTQKCYENSLLICRIAYSISHSFDINNLDLDPQTIHDDRVLQPVEDLREIDVRKGRKINIDQVLPEKVKSKLIKLIKANLHVFAWTPPRC